MHTKKTNNTNKLMQISNHSVLTKIQKLQNSKKKKKTFSIPASIARNWLVRLVFFPVQNRGVECTGLRYDIFRLYQPVRYRIDNLDPKRPTIKPLTD